MAEKKINGRIINKHETEAVWKTHADFIPKQGEFIVYDVDSTHAFQRMKIGDGITKVNDLPFVDKDKLQIGGTQPSFSCTWFNVKS